MLDVGCGTGRLLLDYRGEGIDIDGVDNAPEMLALCREKAEAKGVEVDTYQQAIESLDLPRRYRVIIVPSSTFQLLYERSAATAALESLYRHLLPGGQLVMSFFIPEKRQAEWSEWAPSSRRVDWGQGRELRRYSRAWYDEAEQLEHLDERDEVTRNGVVLESELNSRSPAMRWYTVAQAVDLCRAAGFDPVTGTAGFTRNPASADEQLFCVAATRPGGR